MTLYTYIDPGLLYDTDDDWEPDPACPPELLTVGWWSARGEMIEGEE